MDDRHIFKSFLLLQTIITIIISLLIVLNICIIISSDIEIIWKIILITSLIVILLVSVILVNKAEQILGYYICPFCHSKFTPNFKQIFFASKIGFKKYLRCPKCGRKGWSIKTF